MDQNLILPFIRTTRNLFETMFQMDIEIGSPSIKPPSSPSFDVSGIIGMSGDVEGSVVLSFPMATAVRVVSLFTGQEISAESEDDLTDAIGEVVNMVAGGAKAQLDGKKVSISCPSVVIGEGHTIHGQRDAVCVVVPCQSDCGEFNIEVTFRGISGAEVGAGDASGQAGA